MSDFELAKLRLVFWSLLGGALLGGTFVGYIAENRLKVAYESCSCDMVKNRECIRKDK